MKDSKIKYIQIELAIYLQKQTVWLHFRGIQLFDMEVEQFLKTVQKLKKMVFEVATNIADENTK